MKHFLSRNIGNKGRLLRGLMAVALFVGAWPAHKVSIWFSVGLAVSGVFVLFEALRGWCALRACGVKTKF